MSRSVVRVMRPGVVPYETALQWQETLERQRLAREIPDTLLVVEHPPVITIGHRGQAAHVLASADRLELEGMGVHRVSRGGDVTYHGPGQVVLYPIVDLNEARLGIAEFVELLEETMIRAVRDEGLEAGRLPRTPGVFLGADKVGAVGIHVAHGVTTHGLALNVRPDLSHFQLIIPCGLRSHGVTSLEQAAGRQVDQVRVENHLVQYFAQLLGRVPEERAASALGIPIEQAPA